MNILLRSVCIVDKRSPLNGKCCDIHIRQGIIQRVSQNISAKSCGSPLTVIDADGLHVSIGWFDIGAHFCDPGYEYKEDLDSGIKAAAAGGYTGVLVMPSTLPVIQSKEGVEYIKNKSAGRNVAVYCCGALSVNGQGKDLAEFYDMKSAGAVALSDGKHPVSDAGFLLRALLYARNCQLPVIVHAHDPGISGKLLMNESENSVLFGMKGSPSLAEEIMIQRDIQIADYAGARLHFLAVSSARSVDLIRKAKKQSALLTAGVTAAQLCFDDSALASYDTNFKLNPPLRSRSDINELIKGLNDDTIDIIISDHTPEDAESKNVEFELSPFGMINLQTAFASVNTALAGKIRLDKLIEKFSASPRNVLGLPVPRIEAGQPADLTLFNPFEKWVFTRECIRSRSSNSPFINTELTGKVAGTIYGKKLFLANEPVVA